MDGRPLGEDDFIPLPDPLSGFTMHLEEGKKKTTQGFLRTGET